MNTVVKSLTDYFKTYPELESKTIFVDFLKEKGQSFSIIPVPTRPISRKFIDGSYEKQFSFALAGRFNYSEEIAMNIKNSSFFEDLEEWLTNNNENDILPDLGSEYTSISLEITSNGYLLGVSEDRKTGHYEIRCLLIYEKN